MSKQTIAQLLQKSQQELIGAFSLGNSDMAKKWSSDESKGRVTRAIVQRNLLAAYVNRYIHQFESAGLWYLHGIIAGYLAENKPSFVPKGREHVNIPVLAVDEIEYCMSWLQQIYGPRYAAEQAKELFDVFTARVSGGDSKYDGRVGLHKYGVLWGNDFEQQNEFEPISLGDKAELDSRWRRFPEVPEAYKSLKRGNKTRKNVMAGLGSAQLLEEAVEKLGLADATLQYDEADEQAAKLKSDKIEAYDKELEAKVAEKTEKAAEKRAELIKLLDQELTDLAAILPSEAKAKLKEYQQLLAEIEGHAGQKQPLTIQKSSAASAVSSCQRYLAERKLKLPAVQSGSELEERLLAEIQSAEKELDQLLQKKQQAELALSQSQEAISIKKERVAALLVEIREARNTIIQPHMEEHEKILIKIEDQKATLAQLIASGDVESGEPCEQAIEELNERLVVSQKTIKKIQSAAWYVNNLTAQVGLYEAKARFWNQVRLLHESYRSDPAKKLAALVGAVEPGANELLALHAGIPVGTASGLRHLLFLFLEKAPEVWANRMPEILRTSKLKYTGVDGSEIKLSENSVQYLTKVVVQGVNTRLRSWCRKFSAIDISAKHDARTRSELRGLLSALRNQLYGDVDLATDQDLRHSVEDEDDMFGHPSLASPRYRQACKIVNSIRRRAEQFEGQKVEDRGYRLRCLEDELAQMDLPKEVFGSQSKDQDGGATKLSETEQRVKSLLEDGRTDYGDMLHLVAEHAYRHDMLPLYMQLLKQGASVKSLRHGATVTAALYEKVFLASPAAKEQCWQLFAVARIAEELFETTAGADWLKEMTKAVINKVAVSRVRAGKEPVVNESLSAFYQERDGQIVEEILRRLILDLCLGPVNSQTIWQADSFQDLLHFWRYRQLTFSTPQTVLEGHSDLTTYTGKSNSANRVLMLTPLYLKRELMKQVKDMFASRHYQSLQGVQILAEIDSHKRTELIEEHVRNQYRTKACVMNVKAEDEQYREDPVDVEAIEKKVKEEERARFQQLVKQQQQDLQQKNDAIRAEMGKKITELEDVNKAIKESMGGQIAELSKAATTAEEARERQKKVAEDTKSQMEVLAKQLLVMRKELLLLKVQRGGSANQTAAPASNSEQRPPVVPGSLTHITVLRTDDARVAFQNESEADPAVEEAARAGT